MIPFNNLKKVNSLTKLNFIFKCVNSNGNYILGDEVNYFEKEWAEYCGTKYCVGVANGTDGLVLSLQALGIKQDDKVITVGNSAPATIMAICLIGAVPVLVDIKDNGLIDPEEIVKACEKHKDIKAVIPVHLYGKICNMPRIMDIAHQFNLKVIEDASHAHGAVLNGKKSGSFGDLGVFSFYPTKPLGCLGDAGAIILNDDKMYELLLKLRNYGSKSNNDLPDCLGRNSRLDELQAAFLRLKLKHLDEWNEERRVLVRSYMEKLKNLETYFYDIDDSTSCHLFPILINNRDIILNDLLNLEIQTKVRYQYFRPYFAKHIIFNTDLTQKFCSRVLCLPLWNGLEEETIAYISETLLRLIKDRNEITALL